MDLASKKCVPCEGGVDPLNRNKIDEYMVILDPKWEVIKENKALSKKFKFKNFKEAMKFVNMVANLAEQEGHHPDIYIFYNKVLLELSTHAIEGLSENDFIMAAKINNVVV